MVDREVSYLMASADDFFVVYLRIDGIREYLLIREHPVSEAKERKQCPLEEVESSHSQLHIKVGWLLIDIDY